MSATEENTPEAAPESAPEESVTESGDITKESIRKRIWDYLEDNNLVNFPRPVHKRIPNFEGAGAAGTKAATLDVFQKANTIKINPDKPQEQCRYLTLEHKKTLLVPTPRLRQGLFNQINVPEDANKDVLKICSTSQGIKEYSSPLSLEAKVKIDLVIVGSVAVSTKGYRIGKGEGFADLEFAMMRDMAAVDDNIIIVTTVHESQITDIPDDLKLAHDLTVDYIVTPERVIECPRHEKPTGIIWSMLTKEKLSRVPILRELRRRQKEAGTDVTLADGDHNEVIESAPEDDERRGERRQRDRRRRRKNGPRGPRRESERTDGEKGEGEESGEGEEKDGRRRRNNNNRRRRRRSQRKSEGDEENTGGESAGDGDKENMEDHGESRRRAPRNRRRQRQTKPREGDHSGDEDRERDDKERPEGRPRRRQNSGPLSTVYVGSLPRSLRVSEFKAQVRDRGVNPLRVIWHGASGHAFLQFIKKDEADGALSTLRDLEIDGRMLKVEMSRRGGKGSPEGHEAEGHEDEGEGQLDIKREQLDMKQEPLDMKQEGESEA